MKKILAYIGIALWLLATMPNALAQKSTELFIPIGKSPGLSGEYSVTGKVDSVDMAERIVFMSDSAGESYEVKLDDESKIYLDKSKPKQRNEMGTIADCTKGAYCEVLYESHTRKNEGVAEWMKVRITAEMQK